MVQRIAKPWRAVLPGLGPSGGPHFRRVPFGLPDWHGEIMRLVAGDRPRAPRVLGDAPGRVPGRGPEVPGMIPEKWAGRGGFFSLSVLRDARSVLGRARRRAARRLRRLKGRRGSPTNGRETGGLRPEKLIWIFGAARTGSTWLGSMMADLDGHDWWHEPMVGHLFGHLLNERAGRRRDDEHFIL
jgi:hypothetical protein